MLPSLQPPDGVHEQIWAPVALEECVHECIRFWDDAFAAWQGINPAEVLQWRLCSDYSRCRFACCEAAWDSRRTR